MITLIVVRMMTITILINTTVIVIIVSKQGAGC